MKLVKLEPSSRVEGRWLVWLEDGSLLRVGEGDVVSFSLYAGMELSEEQLEGLKQAQEKAKLKNKALTLLAARPMPGVRLHGGAPLQPQGLRPGQNPG